MPQLQIRFLIKHKSCDPISSSKSLSPTAFFNLFHIKAPTHTQISSSTTTHIAAQSFQYKRL